MSPLILKETHDKSRSIDPCTLAPEQMDTQKKNEPPIKGMEKPVSSILRMISSSAEAALLEARAPFARYVVLVSDPGARRLTVT